MVQRGSRCQRSCNYRATLVIDFHGEKLQGTAYKVWHMASPGPGSGGKAHRSELSTYDRAYARTYGRFLSTIHYNTEKSEPSGGIILRKCQLGSQRYRHPLPSEQFQRD